MWGGVRKLRVSSEDVCSRHLKERPSLDNKDSFSFIIVQLLQGLSVTHCLGLMNADIVSSYKLCGKGSIYVGPLTVDPQYEVVKFVMIREASPRQSVPQCNSFGQEAFWVELTLYIWNIKWMRMCRFNLHGMVCLCF